MAGKRLPSSGASARPGALVIVGSFQSLGILRSLAGHGVPTYLIDWDLCVGRFSRCAHRFSLCPPAVEEARFLQFLRDLAVRENLMGWVIYANDDRTVGVLSRHKRELEEYYRVPVPDWEITKAAIDKRLTHALAERAGVPYPRTFYPGGVDDLDRPDLAFPVIIKPAIRDNYYDKARKKAVRADGPDALRREYLKASSLIDPAEIMVQELIPGGAGNLYSYGSLHSPRGVLGKVVARRTRQHPVEFGRVTTHAETVRVPELEDMGRRLLEVMGYQGISEVEFMLDPRDGAYKLIEINARFWAWHSLAIAAGVDLPYVMYQDMLGEKARAGDFEEGVHWFRLLVDLPVSALQATKGRLDLSAYFRSWRGKRTFSVFSWRDPLPFFAEVLMVPYILKVRGA